MPPDEKPDPRVRVGDGQWEDVVTHPGWWTAKNFAEFAAEDDRPTLRDTDVNKDRIHVQVWIEGKVTRWVVRVHEIPVFRAVEEG